MLFAKEVSEMTSMASSVRNNGSMSWPPWHVSETYVHFFEAISACRFICCLTWILGKTWQKWETEMSGILIRNESLWIAIMWWRMKSEQKKNKKTALRLLQGAVEPPHSLNCLYGFHSSHPKTLGRGAASASSPDPFDKPIEADGRKLLHNEQSRTGKKKQGVDRANGNTIAFRGQ